MASRLPEILSPLRLARHGARLAGRLSSERMARLNQACGDRVADVEVHVEFGTEERVPVMRGTLAAEARVECQRCREPMTLRLETRVELALVAPGDERAHAAAAAAGLDALEVADDRIALTTLVEDELLLALPDYPMHEVTVRDGVAGCRMPDAYAPAGETVGEEGAFAGLGALLTDREPPADDTF